jgi:voltage-gated potassium channel Kch
VLTIDDQHTALRAATLIRAHAPATKIVARARDLSTCDALLQAGVTLAFPETLEASLRLAAESLEALGISSDETGMLLRGVRSTDYALVRPQARRRRRSRSRRSQRNERPIRWRGVTAAGNRRPSRRAAAAPRQAAKAR